MSTVQTEAELKLINPINGEVLNPENIDQLIDAAEMVKNFHDLMWKFKTLLIEALGKHVQFTDDCNTAYLRGKSKRLCMTKPDISWDQSKLKDLFQKSPEFAKDYLRLQSVAVQMRRYKQLEREKGTDAFEAFKEALQEANKGRIGTPQISIEPLDK